MLTLRRTAAALLTMLATALPPAAMAETTTRTFTGYAYTLEGGEFRYTEHHTQSLEDGQVTSWTVDYRDPDGETIATKTFRPGDTPTIPAYDFEMVTTGYREGIRHSDGAAITLYRQKAGESSESTKRLTPREQACADSGFDAYVRRHWDKIVDGETLKFQFIAAGRLNDYGFKAERIDDGRFEDRRTIRIKVALDSLFGIFIDPLVLAYDAETEQLKEYRGIGNIQDADGEVYPVRVSYFSEPPPEAR